MIISDDDIKVELPVHTVIEAHNLSKITTNIPARIGKTSESVAELIKFGWMIMSKGQEDHSNVYLTQSDTHDYEQLCRLKVLGLNNTSDADPYTIYTEFKEQLQRRKNVCYQSELSLKPNHPTLHNKKIGSLACLSNLLSKLQCDSVLFKEYDD